MFQHDYKSRESGCVTNMLKDLEFKPLQETYMINYVLQSGWGTGARHRIRRLFERNNEQKKESNNTKDLKHQIL